MTKNELYAIKAHYEEALELHRKSYDTGTIAVILMSMEIA